MDVFCASTFFEDMDVFVVACDKCNTFARFFLYGVPLCRDHFEQYKDEPKKLLTHKFIDGRCKYCSVTLSDRFDSSVMERETCADRKFPDEPKVRGLAIRGLE